ncbi:WYL domain-containing protein [Kitasatospora sp. NPDC018058]|uniref:WYL domain-containing protein n=1 Tax=Kitasatospora sp. NPDC018058 TaxID=3364025 RepID=UPI0037BE223A
MKWSKRHIGLQERGECCRAHRVHQVIELLELEEEFAMPEGFESAGYRRTYPADFRARLHTGEALVRPTPEGARRLGVTPAGEGRTEARAPIESIDHAYGEFLRLGTDLAVLEPVELRDRIAETARTPAVRYRR